MMMIICHQLVVPHKFDWSVYQFWLTNQFWLLVYFLAAILNFKPVFCGTKAYFSAPSTTYKVSF